MEFIDGVLENGNVDLCGQQEGIEKCEDEFLSSLDGSTLDELTGLNDHIGLIIIQS